MDRITSRSATLHEKVRHACKRTLRRLLFTYLACALLGTALIVLAS